MSDYAEKMLKYGFQFRKVQLILDGTWFEKQTWLLFQFRKVQLIRLHLRCVSSRKEVSIPQGPINTCPKNWPCFSSEVSIPQGPINTFPEGGNSGGGTKFQFRKVQLIPNE